MLIRFLTGLEIIRLNKNLRTADDQIMESKKQMELYRLKNDKLHDIA